MPPTATPGLTIALLLVSWMTTMWALGKFADARERLLDAEQPPPRHSTGRRYQPPPAPKPQAYPEWLFEAPRPGKDVSVCGWPPAYRHTLRAPVSVRGNIFPLPPAPVFRPQAAA